MLVNTNKNEEFGPTRINLGPMYFHNEKSGFT